MYHLIDQKKVGSVFRKDISFHKLRHSEEGTNVFKKVINGVEYSYYKHEKEVVRARPLSEGAIAITTYGLIAWNDFSKEIHYYYDGTEKIETEIKNYDYSHVYSRFCSGYICLGSLPSKGAMKFDAKDIMIFNSREYKIQHPEDLGFRVSQSNDQIVIEKDRDKEHVHYEIGPFINDVLYPITVYAFDFDLDYFKVIITRGTCYRVDYVVQKINERQYDSMRAGNYYELCF